MKLLEQHYQRVKNAIHGLQGLGVFVAWVITIAVFTRRGKSGGQIKYFFALVGISLRILSSIAVAPTSHV